jgi:ABC-type bacteriocin/lantibiotic exporter with double-glycine peptidase domain
MKNIKELFVKNRSQLVSVLWICIIVYAIASINVLILALSIYRNLPGAYLNPRTLLVFSIISFALAVIISAYHLSTLIRRRKRRSDRQKISRLKYIKAKNRPSRRHR